jgi:hypothetical protein
MTKDVFSDYSIDKQVVTFSGATEGVHADCIGSCTQKLESKTITKKCRGVVAKTRTKGTGNGTLNDSMHIPYRIYEEAFGLKRDTLKGDVRAYGEDSRHKEFMLTQHVVDEDGDEKYKCFPRCIISTFPEIETENNADEVAEVELEISLMPDDYGNCLYEVILTDENRDEYADWMEKWSYDLVMASTDNSDSEEKDDAGVENGATESKGEDVSASTSDNEESKTNADSDVPVA